MKEYVSLSQATPSRYIRQAAHINFGIDKYIVAYRKQCQASMYKRVSNEVHAVSQAPRIHTSKCEKVATMITCKKQLTQLEENRC